MKRLFRQMAAFLAFCVLAAAVPPAGLAAEGTVRTILSGTDLYDLFLADAVEDGDTLRCADGVLVAGSHGIDDPWIINKRVTIEGGSLTIGTGGIVLGADVTFQNTQLHFTKPICNAIVANGYALTLDGVTAGSGGYSFNVFCGTLVQNSKQNFTVPVSGSADMVIIQGSTNLQSGNMTENVVGTGNIYAGSLSLGSMDPDFDEAGAASDFAGNPTIRIEGCANALDPLGTVYASGAQQRNPYGVNGQKPTTRDLGKYTVSGTVTIAGTNAVPAVDGAANGDGRGRTEVEFQGGTYEAVKTFQDISSLSVRSGNLVLEAGSRFRGGGALALGTDAKLNVSRFSGSVQDFRGSGGILILGQDQTFQITGEATGMAKIAIGGTTYDDTGSSAVITEGKTYLQTPASSAADFQLLPYAAQPNMKLENDGSGNWVAKQPTQEASKLASLNPPANTQVSSGEKEITIPLNPTYTTEAGLRLEDLLSTIQIYVNSQQAQFTMDQDAPEYSYYTAAGLQLSIGDYGNGESFAICNANDPYNTPVPDDTYKIQITVPGEHTATGDPITASCTLTVGTPDPGAPVVTGISVSSTNHKTEYKVGESLDVTGLTIDVAYSDGSKQTVPVTEGMVGGFDSSKAAESQTLTITHEGHKTTYTIRITASEEPGGTKYQVTLNNLGDGGGGEGSYEGGSTVVIRAGSKSGYTFSAWQQPEGVTLADRNSPETRFTMPGRDVTLLATWTRNGGTPPPGHTHAWGAAWKSNASHHWHDCTASGCTAADNSEKSGYAAHTAGDWVVDRPAASSQSGIRHRSCTVCGYEMARETIPATGGGSSSGGGASSGGNSSSGGSSSSGSSGNTTTVKNPDGSTTATNTNKTTGTVTETTRRPDGSKLVVETKKDGTVTATDTAKDGSTVKTVARPDGVSETTVKRADGLTASVREDGNGARADVRLPSKAVKESQSGGGAVALPIPELPGANASVTVRTGSVRPVRVEIPVRGDENTTVACVVNGDGTETILKTAVLTGGQITVSVPDGTTVRLRDNGRDFRDTRGHWAEDAINFAASRELFAGKTSTAFAPDAPMSRAMLTAVLARLDGVDAAGGAAYEKGMAWAVAQGVSDGRNPEGQVTREQFVVMLYRYAGSPAATDRELHFSDEAAISGYAREAVRWAVENGILSGYGNGSFAPGGKATRAQAAVMLTRYVNYLNGK